MKGLGREPLGKSLLGRPVRRSEDNITRGSGKN
jgi:hypothetical protein